MLSPDEIAERLAQTLPPPKPEDCNANWLHAAPRPAAVLIPFVQVDHSWQIVFTRRTDKVAEHKGQVAFPGGRSDPGDPTPEFTALREANEEIGLKPDDVQLLGRLAKLPTTSGYCVTPVVGMLNWPYQLHLAPSEVVRAFTIPLDWLANPENHEVRERQIPGSDGYFPVIYFKHYDGELLWGVSAQITMNLLSALQLARK